MFEQNTYESIGDLEALDIQASAARSEWMTKQELAKYLRCSISLINGMMLDGLPYRGIYHNPLYSRSEIEAWLRASQ
jgi:hypothetical protein